MPGGLLVIVHSVATPPMDLGRSRRGDLQDRDVPDGAQHRGRLHHRPAPAAPSNVLNLAAMAPGSPAGAMAHSRLGRHGHPAPQGSPEGDDLSTDSVAKEQNIAADAARATETLLALLG